MKKLMLLFALMVICTFKAHGQQTLAWYGFDASNLAPTFVDNTLVSASNIAMSGVNFTPFGNGVTGIPDMAPYSNQWPNYASPPNQLDLGRYYEFTITAMPGKSVAVNQIKVWVTHTINGPTSFSLRSNAGGNNFTTDIYSGPVSGPSVWSSHSFGLFFPAISNGESLTFRMYAYNASNPIGRFAIDSLFIRGFENSPLPITLTSFEGSVEGVSTHLSWQTASERNNEHFTIFRSQDLEDWSEVGQVAGAGNSYQNLSYSMRDESPPGGVSYYRLRQTDYDGTYEDFAQVVAVEHRHITSAVYRLGDIVTLGGERSVLFDHMGRLVSDMNTNHHVFKTGHFILRGESGSVHRVEVH